MSDALHGRPVVKSRMYGNGSPLLSTLCEKSPRRSSAVGTRALCTVGGLVRRWNSSLQKKNSFFFSSLKPGNATGPPIVYPESLRDVFGFGTSGVSRLFKYELAFHADRCPYQ